MASEQVLRAASVLGLVVEQQETGLRLYDADGRLLGSQLTHEQVEVFLYGRLEHGERQRQQGSVDSSFAFPPL